MQFNFTTLYFTMIILEISFEDSSLSWNFQPRVFIYESQQHNSPGSDTKKNRGNSSLFFSRYPVRDFWQSSSCSSRCGKSCPRVSSPTQHCTTLGISWALPMILIHDLSMLLNRLASCGSCLAISPPTNTASRYTHRFCTSIQLSIISEELERFCTQS